MSERGSRPDVALSVGSLAIEGLAPGRRHTCADAFEAEMARLIAERGIGAAAEGELALPQLTVSAPIDGSPEALGRAVAAALHAALLDGARR